MRLCPATEADAQGAADLVIACDIAQIGEVDYSLGDLRDEWRELAFARVGGYEPKSQEAWTQRELQAHGIDHALSRVAIQDGEPAGFALARRWEDDVIYVPLLAVHPDAAGKGLGGWLLRSVFAAAVSAKQRQVRLNVASDNPNAVRLYERVGMGQAWRVDDYQKALPD